MFRGHHRTTVIRRSPVLPSGLVSLSPAVSRRKDERTKRTQRTKRTATSRCRMQRDRNRHCHRCGYRCRRRRCRRRRSLRSRLPHRQPLAVLCVPLVPLVLSSFDSDLDPDCDSDPDPNPDGKSEKNRCTSRNIGRIRRDVNAKTGRNPFRTGEVGTTDHTQEKGCSACSLSVKFCRGTSEDYPNLWLEIRWASRYNES